jgi:hypothetical protein
VLERAGSEALVGDELDEAIDLATRVCDGVGYEGKPLAAANRALPLPDEPLVRLWQLVTIIREWRGDAHIAALQSTPLTAVEALVLHAGTGTVPVKFLKSSRAWPEEIWRATADELAARGLVDADGGCTPDGTAFREEVEHRTDVASLPLWEAIGAEATARLDELLVPVRDALVESGAFGRPPTRSAPAR